MQINFRLGFAVAGETVELVVIMMGTSAAR